MDEKIKWRCSEYKYTPKASDWFWYVASGALVVVVVAILMRNFLFAVFAILAALVVMILGAKRPREVDFVIDAREIKIGKKTYPYEEIESFWINYDPPRKKELIIKSKGKLTGIIKIPMANADPSLIRKKLAKILKEEKIEETLTEAIADYLGF